MSDSSSLNSNPPPPSTDDGELRCPACDYDLRALSGDRCPECGLLIDRQSLSVSQIPWTHRRTMGTFRAFRRTVWLTFRRPKQIAADVSMPVSLVDAKRFQRVVLWLAFVPFVGIGLWGYISTEEIDFSSNGITLVHWYTTAGSRQKMVKTVPSGQHLGWILEIAGVFLTAICLWLALKAVTGVASYFHHPRDLAISRQNRAIALSYYACAALAWTPVSVALFVGLGLFTSSERSGGPVGYRIEVLLFGLLFLSVGVQLAAWWRCSLVLLKRTTRCSATRVTVLGISLPFLWALCAALALSVLPLAYVLVCIVILSLK